jgi:hypothetical protein
MWLALLVLLPVLLGAFYVQDWWLSRHDLRRLYEQVQVGMTRDEVEAILGPPDNPPDGFRVEWDEGNQTVDIYIHPGLDRAGQDLLGRRPPRHRRAAAPGPGSPLVRPVTDAPAHRTRPRGQRHIAG